MDVRKVLLCITFILISVGLQNATATISGLTLHTDDGSKKCTTKLDTCKLKTDDLPLLKRGEKGDKGDAGTLGLQGVKGDRGDPGMPAPKPLNGVKGEKGDPGLPGSSGPRGISGSPGEMGPGGLAGPVGPPGTPGRPGICPCKFTPKEDDYNNEDIEEFGSQSSPAEVTCKFAPAGTKSRNYFMGPSSQAFEVYCNMTSKETCVLGMAKTPSHNYNSTYGTFWLSEVGIEIREIYNLTTQQIKWLQDRSESVRQTMKYNCLDSVPYPKHNLSSSVQLLTWTDIVIGPFPTKKSPLFYSVPPATDGCVEGSTSWKNTIIEVQSSNVKRLPITDLWIGDVRIKSQIMNIESVELCFG